MHSLKPHLTALAAFLALASAHVKIESPVPYGAGNSAPALDTNPLLADGSDYPCKQRPDVYKLVKNNVMAIGEPQTLSFQGQATHGGGSCQISLSTDKQPTKDSVFKVIYSIEGGCPSKNPGNVGVNPFGYGADKFQYSIPPEISPGDYTLAWTWFNKIGEREMYMNCAPVTVTGSPKLTRDLEDDDNNTTTSDADGATFDKRDMSSLPDMFKANIGNGCETAPSGTDLAIPAANLGKYTQRINTGPLTPPVGNCGGSSTGSPSSSGSGGGGAAIPAAAQPSASSIPAAQPSTPAAAQPSASTTPAVPAAQASTPAAAPEPQPSTSTSTPSPQPSQSPAPASSTPQSPVPAGLTTGTCPTPGKSVCSPDGTAMGTCMENNQVIFQKVPEGTRCDLALGVEVHARRNRLIRKQIQI